MSNFQRNVNKSVVRDFTTRRQAKKSHLADVLASLFNDSLLRITYFDQMTHDDAVEMLMSAVETQASTLPNFLNYYGCKVADISTVALFYGVDAQCVQRACKYWQSELLTDGLLCLTRGEVRKAVVENDIELNYATVDAVTYLLPPRVIAKLAFVLPATKLVQAVISVCNKSFAVLDASEITLPGNDIINGTRLSPTEIAKYTAQAKVLRRYAYVGHFGDHVSRQTWERLFNYKGSYPPPHGIGTVKVSDKI